MCHETCCYRKIKWKRLVFNRIQCISSVPSYWQQKLLSLVWAEKEFIKDGHDTIRRLVEPPTDVRRYFQITSDKGLVSRMQKFDNKTLISKIISPGWCGLSTGLWTKMSLVPFPVRAQAWIEGQDPCRGRARGNWLMFLSLPFSHPSLLSENK